MKSKAHSEQIQIVRQLLGLALIGLVLWLAAIGWLPVASAHAAPGAPRHGDPEKRLAGMQTPLNPTAEQVDPVREARRDQRRPRHLSEPRRP